MSKGQTKAELLLRELRAIPKLIKQLQRDLEATKTSLLTSPQWSDMRVSGGVKKTQEDKNIFVIDSCEWHIKRIKTLLERKHEILDIISEIPDIEQQDVLISAYLTYDSYVDAQEGLDLSTNKFFRLRRMAIDSLNKVIDSKK
ncbi:DUF1492 domain-containing protein [Streptococcus hyovaginalis]|uniref:Uncharacterized protein n=1 Tax=Streptococcus agalactiae LMG 14747 TaxID=1154860 RepID=V6Z2J0_STRAG|nr:DUF1492 domain-containing protein [Streptococcus hyovaginalis]ESV55155.1 hypothetical protein SAG0136_08035 [Streptococcus agalactiae LMG 14747]MDY4511808.1 DUF1492 domain-containing protein [Streptococcus hyovaginalis]MDY5974328.1 DUF1492 domain-containing protein [Streptococcus hyovaginalis]